MMDGGPVGNGVVKDEAAIGERQKRKNAWYVAYFKNVTSC
tara:strand:- start:282 stop:401 length:120 start_codon:yes stop_codon:yes gene_type:complete